MLTVLRVGLRKSETVIVKVMHQKTVTLKKPITRQNLLSCDIFYRIMENISVLAKKCLIGKKYCKKQHGAEKKGQSDEY